MKWWIVGLVILLVFLKVFSVDFWDTERGKTIVEVLKEEARYCEVDWRWVAAILMVETHGKNVYGDGGDAVGYFQMHKEAGWYVAEFYPDAREFLQRLKSWKDLIYFPNWQARLAYRYLCLLWRNISGKNILLAVKLYNGSERNEYLRKVIQALSWIILKFPE